MVGQCYALWIFPLPSGNCADWFSGTWTAIAVAIAAATYGISEFRIKKQDRRREKAIGRQIGVKLFRLMNEAHNMLRHIRPLNCPPNLSLLEFDYRDVNPLVGAHFDVNLQLDAVEIDLLSRANDPDFMMDFMMAIERHRSIVESLHEYKARYEALQTMMPAPVDAKGNIMTYDMSKEEALRLSPSIATINALLNATVGLIRENVILCDRIGKLYNPLMKKHLRLKQWMDFASAPDED